MALHFMLLVSAPAVRPGHAWAEPCSSDMALAFEGGSALFGGPACCGRRKRRQSVGT
ncbi:MAG: hypothetical protein AAGF31_10265 [Planctomycetota bacterium]